MASITDITRVTSGITLRDSEYTAFTLPEGLHYQYTEIHSDGTRAVKVRLDRTVSKDDATITVWAVRIDGHEAYLGVPWQKLFGVPAPDYDWHYAAVSHSHWSAPTVATTIAQDLVNRALGIMGWDSK